MQLKKSCTGFLKFTKPQKSTGIVKFIAAIFFQVITSRNMLREKEKLINIKKFILATLAGSVTMWLLAGLWHKLILTKFYASETDATHEGTGIIFLAYLALGFLMAYIYQLGYKGGRPAVEGLRFGIVIGILWVFPHELVMAGAHGDSISYVFKNAAWHIIEQGIGGIIIGLVYGKLQS